MLTDITPTHDRSSASSHALGRAAPALEEHASHGNAPNYVRMPLKRELQSMPFGERVRALMACADHHLEEMDRLEDPDRTDPLTEWDRRQLASHRASLRRVLERAAEFGIKLTVTDEWV
ncbi:hypothetical protein [Methylobacterium nodulans]|uniref:Uncharacterized protein n=1 Tax=Methylobacterium nodulans (strain LMG 21967 / CNCM I-2342 / ORS 2060) TaxID=460265 RepID=B8IW72_METNO|nr:hypothetical protein [Methylobacterium nodulans]ACL62662.1 hypothetical protein Mnod_8576 [Methylobacterium nodulans ORS 2060]